MVDVNVSVNGSYGDGLEGFTIKGNTPYWGYLHSGNAFKLKANEQYLLCMRHMQKDGVAFKDIRNRLLNEAKTEGLYYKTKGPWAPDGGYRPLNDMVKARVAWALALNNFTTWISRNWVSYTEPMVKSEAEKKPKTRQEISLPKLDGTFEARKITIRNLSDLEYEDWILSMKGEGEDASPEALERMIKRDAEKVITCILNVVEEDVKLFNYLVDELNKMTTVAPVEAEGSALSAVQ